MAHNRELAHPLAIRLLDGPWTKSALEARIRRVLGARSRKLALSMAQEIWTSVATPYAPSPRLLSLLIARAPSLRKVGKASAKKLLGTPQRVARRKLEPLAALRGLDIPKLTSTTELANWLELPFELLQWLTDERRTLSHSQNAILQHYVPIWVPKRSGSLRLLEAPKSRMKCLQKKILTHILDKVPTHNAAYGFVRQRSGAQAASLHAGEDVVVTMDLKDFFLTTPLPRVHAIFRCIGYPWAVARALTSLSSTSTPALALSQAPEKLDFDTRHRLAERHLPQGAPTSPALANLAAYRLDARLTGLASRFDARYTRYADDLTFSGDSIFQKQLQSFQRAVSTIVADEGFLLNQSKTRIMPRSGRQIVTGIVVNDHINIARKEFDLLKATLTNCLRTRPSEQNRTAHTDFKAHLCGRVSWVEQINPARGAKLRSILESIAW